MRVFDDFIRRKGQSIKSSLDHIIFNYILQSCWYCARCQPVEMTFLLQNSARNSCLLSCMSRLSQPPRVSTLSKRPSHSLCKVYLFSPTLPYFWTFLPSSYFYLMQGLSGNKLSRYRTEFRLISSASADRDTEAGTDISCIYSISIYLLSQHDV
jgi:hypothetical protein